MPAEVEPLLLSIANAAKALDISEWTVRYLLRTRQLSRVRIGARVLISASELSRFIREHTEAAIDHTEETAAQPRAWRGGEILVDRSGD